MVGGVRFRWMLLGVAGLCFAALLALWPGGSRAAFPGANGDIAFSRQTGPILVPKGAPSPGGIFTVAPNGKDVNRVTTGEDDDPGFSPNGKWIVFTRRGEKRGLYRVRADGSGLKRLTTDSSDDNAAYSPDGKRIVFARGSGMPVKRGGTSGPDIWVMRADGTGEHALTSNPAPDDFPSYSPNGKRIAFDSERNGNFDIFEMRADGTNEHALTTGGRDEHDPNYSPDGELITYSKLTGSDYDVFAMNADGSHQKRLTTTNAFEGRSAYSPSGRKIVYVRDTRREKQGDVNLYVMDADGSGKHALTEGTKVEHVSPDWGPKP